jgi:hypothetical protein
MTESFGKSKNAQTVKENALRLLELSAFNNIKYYKSKVLGFKINHEYSIDFFKGFMNIYFLKKLNREIQLLLRNGKFYKSHNRDEFVDSYNNLTKSLSSINDMDQRFSLENGDIGKIVKNRKQLDESSLKKLKSDVSYCFREIDELLKKIRSSLLSFNKVFEGVVKGKSGSEYDTISNFAVLFPEESQQRLDRGLKVLQSSYKLLNELYDLET